jgi:hypothetical protein
MCTPSSGYLVGEDCETYPWICHLCRKKFLAEDGMVLHVSSVVHQKRTRTFEGYVLEDFIARNKAQGFYGQQLPQVSVQSQTVPPEWAIPGIELASLMLNTLPEG